MIKIDFEFDTPYGIFRDALHLPEDHGLNDAQIQAVKEQRRDNWIAVVKAPPAEETVQDYVEIDGVKYVKVAE